MSDAPQYPAGYYADPSGTSQRRYWTGSEWGELEPTPATEPPVELPPAGYYADPENPLRQRYWDGAAWAAAEPSATPLATDPASIYDPVPRREAPAPAMQPVYDVSTEPRPRRLSRSSSTPSPTPPILDRYSNEDHAASSSPFSHIPALSNLRIPSMRTLVIGCLVVVLVVIGIGVATKKPVTSPAAFCTSYTALESNSAVNLSYSVLGGHKSASQMRAARAKLLTAAQSNLAALQRAVPLLPPVLASVPSGILATTMQKLDEAVTELIPILTRQVTIDSHLPVTPTVAQYNVNQRRYATATKSALTLLESAAVNQSFATALSAVCPTSSTTLTTMTLP